MIPTAVQDASVGLTGDAQLPDGELAKIEEPRGRVQIVPPQETQTGRSEPAPRGPHAIHLTFTRSDEIGEIVKALAAAQAEFGDVERTLTAKVESRRTGGKYEYDYETLADILTAVRPALNRQEIFLSQPPGVLRQSDGRTAVVVATLLMHASGQWLRNDVPFPVEILDAQGIASAITYACRYSLKAMLGIAPHPFEEDDGARSSGIRREARSEPSPRVADGEARVKITACRKLKVQGRDVYGVKATEGAECYTEDATLFEAAKECMKQETAVVLRCELRTGHDKAQHRWLIELVR